MKIYLALLLTGLFTITSSVLAQTNLDTNWVLVEKSDTVDFYIDSTSIKRSGDIVTAWGANIIKKQNVSVKVLKEFNCKTKQEKTLSGTAFSKKDFTGETFPVQKKDWDYVVRESIGETILEYVCKKAPKGLMDYIK